VSDRSGEARGRLPWLPRVGDGKEDGMEELLVCCDAWGTLTLEG
jgi:hypothetical protein